MEDKGKDTIEVISLYPKDIIDSLDFFRDIKEIYIYYNKVIISN